MIAEAAPILDRIQLPDAIVADVIFALSHPKQGKEDRGPKYINYRDLSVQQLGSVYERILEHGLRASADGRVEIAADDEARHASGSYYTPDSLVGLIIEKAVGPLVQERISAFSKASGQLKSEKRSTAARLADLAALDPASRILDFRICDPAMGSAHFLVNLVDWLADHVLAAMAEAASLVEWGDYVSPLARRIAEVRTKILSEAKKHGWPIVEGQLDDRHLVRRMVLKRVVYGVDKNPMAVELAKVTLWLHSFTVGAPLSFLDHHLRCGNSLLGGWVRPTVEALQARGALFNVGQIQRVEQVAGVMSEIEQMTDNDVAEVVASKTKFGLVEEATKPIASLFSLLTAGRVLGIFDAAPKKAPDLRKLSGMSEKQIAKARANARSFERAAALQLVLEGSLGDPIRIAEGEERIATPELKTQISLIPEDVPPEQEGLFPSLRLDDRRRVTADLRYFTTFVEHYPIAPRQNDMDVEKVVAELTSKTERICIADNQLLEWLEVEFDIDRPRLAIANAHKMGGDAFVAAIRQTLPRSHKLSLADVARLKQEHAGMAEPARAVAQEVLTLERTLSDLVNAAYGLTPEEVKLMWQTAPPRMPLPPPQASQDGRAAV